MNFNTPGFQEFETTFELRLWPSPVAPSFEAFS